MCECFLSIPRHSHKFVLFVQHDYSVLQSPLSMSTHHYYYRRKIQWFPLQLPLDSFFSIPPHSLFYYSVKQTILLIVWLCDLFFAGRFQLYIAMFGFHRMKTKRKNRLNWSFLSLLGFAFIGLISFEWEKFNRINWIEWIAEDTRKTTRNCNLRYLNRSSSLWLVVL